MVFPDHFIQGVVAGSSLLYVVPDPSGGVGFTVRSVPLTGGTPSTVYSDTTGCRPFPDTVTDGRLVFDESFSTFSVSGTWT